jgi:hypothetical protein
MLAGLVQDVLVTDTAVELDEKGIVRVHVTDAEIVVRGVLSPQQRRDSVALICRVVRTSRHIGPAQTARLAGIRQRLAGDAMSAEELQAWLRVGPPAVSTLLPDNIKMAFQDACIAVIGEDGHCDAHEMRVICDILREAFDR